MSDQQSDPLRLSAELGAAAGPTADEVAASEVFAEPEPASRVTGGQADEAALLEQGEATEEVPGPDADGEPVQDSV